ncbi:MAG: hypothetical protein ISS74_04730 [Planctomycetes bacterium]|nr:hypothetical protein [Planctomycetota bacterium]
MADNHDDRCHVPVLSWWELWPMLAWGAYTVYLYATGRIFFLLQRIYGHIALAGACLLLAAFVYGWGMRLRRLRAERRRQAEDREAGRLDALRPLCICGAGEAGWGRYVRSLAFLVPLVVGFSLPARGVNALAAVQWGAGDVAMMAQLAAQKETERTEMRGEYGWTTLTGVAQRLSAGRQEKVGAMAFIARKKGQPRDQFYLVRFMMNCCAACAQPVAVPARLDEAALRGRGFDPKRVLAALDEDQWVNAYGRLDPEGEVLWVEDITFLEREPDDPYL